MSVTSPDTSSLGRFVEIRGVDAVQFPNEVMCQIERRDAKEAAEAPWNGVVPPSMNGLSWPTREAVRDVCILDRLTRLLKADVSVDDRLTRSLFTYFVDEHEGHARPLWLV